MTFNSLPPTIVFQEVPNEISLCFSITGCQVGCKGCHSTELWNKNSGEPLTNTKFQHWINKYQTLISTVLFMGGEWQKEHLIEKLIWAKQQGLKTCLYTGENFVDDEISKHLSYVKIGKWDPSKGGLNNPDTNQKFIDLATGNTLNHLFIKKGIQHVAA
ncbi:anaerobic ribonucleoside-triphosphate reductase activating protein [Thalassotalea nanhaiensis]|uniref:Anaerobic ribonucleoside-triphosphate reductase activating protein n=1 Tax=Thalassotalea nanhaiensis TaxID=3065648 RepID=A0ABY9TMI6_9GAMM|nr:anaerobic ribonucleoside-triphosphate reductase activating protein [Colwelliaceae bacterium SQ345]